MISKQTLEEIRSRISIVVIVGERLPLKKSGRNFKGICPFHQEKTPSMMVSEEKQIFHCFGCSQGGDIFTFLMKIDGLTFFEAIQELANRAGVKLPQDDRYTSKEADQASAKKKELAFKLNTFAKDFFAANLRHPQQGEAARRYLQSRGLKPETIEQLSIGLAPNSWEGLFTQLKTRNAPLSLAKELGLIKQKEDGGYFDFFRNRIIFPIFDLKGNVAAFGGRTLEKEDGAKYLNSSDSNVYHKSQTFYGLNFAKESIQKKDEVIVVEGYMDWSALWQSGIQNVSAPCGTALTSDHIRLLCRYTRNFFLAFDGDHAGIEASFRSLPLFLELGLTPRILLLPTGMDPDNFIQQQGVTGFEKLKMNALTLFEFLIDTVCQREDVSTAGVLKAWEALSPLLNQVKNPLERGIYLKRVAQRTQMSEKELLGGLKPQKRTLKPAKTSPISQDPLEEKLLIAGLVLKPQEVAKTIRQGGRLSENIFTKEHLKEISKQLFLTIDEEREESPLAAVERCDPILAGWVREIALAEEEDLTSWDKIVRDCLAKIDGNNLKKQLNDLNQKISLAEKGGDENTLFNLLREKKQLLEIKKGIAL